MNAVLPRNTRPQPPERTIFVAFALEGRRWALPGAEVDSVAELPAIAPLPTADPRRLGVFAHRGRVVAAVSTTGTGEAGSSGSYVVLREEGFAVRVDELLGLEVTYDGQIPEGFELFDRGALVRALAATDPASADRQPAEVGR